MYFLDANVIILFPSQTSTYHCFEFQFSTDTILLSKLKTLENANNK